MDLCWCNPFRSIIRLIAKLAFAASGILFLCSPVSEGSQTRMVTRQLNTTFEMGRDATLTCSVRNIGKKRVIWRKLSEPFPLTVGTTRFGPANKYRVKRQNEDWRLVIKNVDHSDAGEYECRLSGQEDISQIMSLLIPGSDHTYLHQTDTTITTPLGHTVILPCHVENLRKNLVLWLNESGRVVSLRKKVYSGDKRHKLLHTSKPQWSLQIRNVQPQDLGLYTCVVNTRPPLTRTVLLEEGKPHDKDPNTGASKGRSPVLNRDTFRDEVAVKQYGTVTLTCQFFGDPRPVIKWERRLWTRDGTKIVEDLKTQGEQFTLTNAQPDDTGVYVCKASNGVPPPDQAKIRLLVKEVPTTTTPIPTTTVFDPIEAAAPRTYPLETLVQVRLGHDGEMGCRAVGVPRPDLYWRLDDTPLENDYKYAIRHQDYRHHTKMSWLRVKSVHPGNYKDYQCVAVNRYGRHNSTIVLARRP